MSDLDCLKPDLSKYDNKTIQDDKSYGISNKSGVSKFILFLIILLILIVFFFIVIYAIGPQVFLYPDGSVNSGKVLLASIVISVLIVVVIVVIMMLMRRSHTKTNLD